VAPSRVSLGAFPTAIEEVTGLAGDGGRLFVKREDLSSAAYGGNKVRKLEYLLAAALPDRPVVVAGASGSHHLLASAIHGRALRLAVHAVVAPQPRTPHERRNAARLADLATVHPVGSRFAVPWGMAQVAASLRRGAGPPPLVVAPGGSSPLGVVGWVAGGLEVAEQVEAGFLPEPDTVWVALGSMGTAAGLLLGLRLGGLSTRVLAVRVVEWPLASGAGARLLARRALALLRGRGLVPPDGFHLGGLEVVEGFLGRGYGHPTPAGEAAAGSAPGIPVEPTYTAKTLAACLAALREGGAGRTALFLATADTRVDDGQVPSR